MKTRSLLPLQIGLAIFSACRAFAEGGVTSSEPAFDRIVHGWTNYSTAFNATQSLDSSSEYATVASFYRPGCDAHLVEYRTIVIWAGSLNQKVNFENFDFAVFVWSSLNAFTNSPLHGDLATIRFAAPTGGSTTIPDAITRAGRPAYELRFCLTNTSITLEHGRSYLVGFGARNHASGYPDLFVPTSVDIGESDLQAGNILISGWIQLANAGGATVYSGRLATALYVQSIFERPALNIAFTDEEILLSWPAAAGCFQLEAKAPGSNWSDVMVHAATDGTVFRLTLPTTASAKFFRLRK